MYQHKTIHECLKFVCAYKTTVTRILYHIGQLQSFRKSFYVMEIHSPSTMSIAKMYLLILQFEQWHFRFSKIYSFQYINGNFDTSMATINNFVLAMPPQHITCFPQAKFIVKVLKWKIRNSQSFQPFVKTMAFFLLFLLCRSRHFH